MMGRTYLALADLPPLMPYTRWQRALHRLGACRWHRHAASLAVTFEVSDGPDGPWVPWESTRGGWIRVGGDVDIDGRRSGGGDG